MPVSGVMLPKVSFLMKTVGSYGLRSIRNQTCCLRIPLRSISKYGPRYQ